MAGNNRPSPRVTVNDLLETNRKFKRPGELPRRVRKELESFSVDADGRIKGFLIRNQLVRFRVSNRRKKKRWTKALEREVLRRLEESIACASGGST
jgi:hypothetical protein